MPRRPLSLPLALAAVACFAATAAGQVTAHFGPDGVWTLPEAAWTACLKRNADATGCLASLMRDGGASPQAVAINTLLDGEGYMTAFRETGRVDVAEVTFPLRANSNEVTYLVNGEPPLVSSELDADIPGLAANAQYAAIKRSHPDVMTWPVGEGPRAVEALAGGGQGFAFAYALLNGCHACEVLGHVAVSFDFGPDGTFRGQRLVSVDPAP